MPLKPNFHSITLSDAEKIYKRIKKILPYKTYLVGSSRREEEHINDIDIMVIDANANILLSHIKTILSKIERAGDRLINGVYHFKSKPVFVDFFIVLKQELPYAMLQYTGPKTYNIRIRKYVKDKGWLLNQYGLFYASRPNVRVKGTSSIKTERELINFIGTHYYHPRDRH